MIPTLPVIRIIFNLFENKKRWPYPHDVFQRILVEQTTLLGGLLQSIDKPGAGNPIGVELVGWNRLKELLLVHRHESGFHDVVERRESLLDCGGDGAEDEDHCQVHPSHQRSAKHS